MYVKYVIDSSQKHAKDKFLVHISDYNSSFLTTFYG